MVAPLVPLELFGALRRLHRQYHGKILPLHQIVVARAGHERLRVVLNLLRAKQLESRRACVGRALSARHWSEKRRIRQRDSRSSCQWSDTQKFAPARIL